MTQEPDKPRPTNNNSPVFSNEELRGGSLAIAMDASSCSADVLTATLRSIQRQTWREWILNVVCPEQLEQAVPAEIKTDRRIRFQPVGSGLKFDAPSFATGFLVVGAEWKQTELEECVWTLVSASTCGWVESAGLFLVRDRVWTNCAQSSDSTDPISVKRAIEGACEEMGLQGYRRNIKPRQFLDRLLGDGMDGDNNASALAEFPNACALRNTVDVEGKRLFLVVPSMHLGGADRFNLNLISQMNQLGWRVTVLVTDRGGHAWRQLFEEGADEVFVLPEFVSSTWAPKALEYFIGSRNPAVVLIAGSEKAYWFLPYIRSCYPELPIVDYSHIEEEYWKHGGIPRFAGRNSPLLNLNLVSSEHLKTYLLDRFSVPETSVEVVTTNIDTDYWCPDLDQRIAVRKNLGVSEDTAVVLFAGRICFQKQPKVLAETIQLVGRESVDVEFWIAGDGEDKSWLETFVQDHGLQSKVRFIGSVPPDKIRSYMQAADIFFLPSLWEGIALALYEAMSVGLAVVASEVGGQSELVLEGSGYLVRRSDVDSNTEAAAYAAVLLELIRKPDTRRAVGEQARLRICEQYPFRDLGTKLIAAFERAATIEVDAMMDPKVAYEMAVQAVEYFRLASLFEDTEQSYRKWFSKLQEKAAWLQSERDALEEEIDSLQGVLKSFKDQCNQLLEAKEWLESQNQSMQSFIKEQGEAHENEKQAFQEHIEQLQSHIAELQAGRDWQEQQIEAVGAYNEELKASNDWQTQQIKAVEAYNEELKSGNAWQAQQLKEMGLHVDDLKNGIEFHKNQSDHWEAMARRLEDELYRRKNWWKVWRRWIKEDKA